MNVCVGVCVCVCVCVCMIETRGSRTTCDDAPTHPTTHPHNIHMLCGRVTHIYNIILLLNRNLGSGTTGLKTPLK
jgi:hypothetical protein